MVGASERRELTRYYRLYPPEFITRSSLQPPLLAVGNELPESIRSSHPRAFRLPHVGLGTVRIELCDSPAGMSNSSCYRARSRLDSTHGRWGIGTRRRERATRATVTRD